MSEIELERVLDKLEETEKSQGPLPPFCKEWNWGKGVIDEAPHHEKIHKYWVKVHSTVTFTETNIIFLETDKDKRADKVSPVAREANGLFKH